VAALASPSAETRRQGALQLAEVGTMADVKPLVAALRDPDELTRAVAEHALWQVWSRSGDAKIDALYRRGVGEMQSGRLDAGIATFTEIIRARPAFAEGWNKRATLYYMAGDFKRSLADCDEVMKRNPWHFGALAGYGQIYFQLEQPEKALEYFRKALAVNPNMQGVRLNIEGLEELLAAKRGKVI
jgi:tetratricopeptide (TPR) repeat protein